MIPISLYLFWLLIVLFCAGSVAERLLRALEKDAPYHTGSNELVENVSDTLLLGLAFLTTLVSLASLVQPVDLKLHLGVSILMLALAGRHLWRLIRAILSQRPDARLWLLWVAGAICLGTMIFIATDKTTHYDTGLYHAQMVKWNKEFGVVPGLANLQGRLGFNSSWDLFASFVDQGYFGSGSFHITNLLLGTIFLFACFQGFRRLLTGDRTLGTFLRCLGLLVILHDDRLLLASLSSDWPTAFLLYYVMILAVDRIEKQMATENPAASRTTWKTGLAAALALFTVTIKLSSLPILLLLLVWIRFAPDKRRAAILILAPAIVVIIPFVARNIILTGYVVYPLAAVDLFGFDWKVPRADVQAMASIIKYWAINPVDDWYRAKEMGLVEQIQTWLKWRGTEAVSFLPWFCLGIVAWLGVTAWGKARRRGDFLSHCGICCILLAGILFCLLNAPEPRYASAWFLVFGLFPAAWLLHVLAGSAVRVAERWKLAGYLLLAGCTMWMVRYAGVKRMIVEKGAPLWKIADFPVAKVKEVQSKYGVVVNIAVEGNRTWDAALPTTTSSLELHPWLQMRGQTLQQGFRVTKADLSIEEKVDKMNATP